MMWDQHRCEEPPGPFPNHSKGDGIEHSGRWWVDREFLCILASFELAFNSFWACIAFLLSFFGEPWALFGTPWGAIGIPRGTLWGTWDCIGVSWGCLGTTSGHLGLDVGMSGDHLGTYWNSGVRRNPHRNCPAVPGVPAVPAKRSANYSSTRAGNQDDVSFTNSLKLKTIQKPFARTSQ